MMLICVDPLRCTHTATAVGPAPNSYCGSTRIDARVLGYRQLLAWAQWPERTWAVENAKGLGDHLALWLVSIREVVDVALAATALVRQLSRGGRRKNARIDAAATHGDASRFRRH
ncbi:hypothetical protein ABZW96_37405 [Nocardia sp. NPDC004168]|uniref:hypothetical protein n=1 Tax=Nocardia sp. NPDC004168 TaxID=3154452 RepID=UPI0033AC59CF